VNFALSDEQEFLKEAARGALSRVKTLEAAREALDGGELPDLWPTAEEAGWTGLLVSEEHGGAGLHVMEGMLVFSELGRVLAGVGLLGHLPATFLLERGGADPALLEALPEVAGTADFPTQEQETKAQQVVAKRWNQEISG
jgi:alkylation response protein AidB-like acyl-CoA dehydrogenase